MKMTQERLIDMGYTQDMFTLIWHHPDYKDYPRYHCNLSIITEPTREQVGGDHYGKGVDCIDFIEANDIPFLEGNVIKYVYRHASKNGVEDIDKAISYLNRIKIERYNADNK